MSQLLLTVMSARAATVPHTAVVRCAEADLDTVITSYNNVVRSYKC